MTKTVQRGFTTANTDLICDHACRMKAVEDRRRTVANHALVTGKAGR